MFIENKYREHYQNLMNTRKTRIREANVYYESHHIIPKSMGGADDDLNLVYLTAKEHFLAHLLLTKITRGEDKKNMVYAWNMMSNFDTRYGKKHITSRLYSVLREEHAAMASEANKGENHPFYGKTHSEESKRKIGEAKKGITLSDETKRKMSEAHKGKTLSEEHKRKLSEVQKGKTHSEETKRKMSEAHKGKTPSDETKQKMSEASKGQIPWNRNKTHSKETKRKMREARKKYWAERKLKVA